MRMKQSATRESTSFVYIRNGTRRSAAFSPSRNVYRYRLSIGGGIGWGACACLGGTADWGEYERRSRGERLLAERSKIGEITVPVIGTNVSRCYQTVTKTVTVEIFTGLATFRANRTGASANVCVMARHVAGNLLPGKERGLSRVRV